MLEKQRGAKAQRERTKRKLVSWDIIVSLFCLTQGSGPRPLQNACREISKLDMMRGGWLLSIYRENFVDKIRRSLKMREKIIIKNREGNKKVGVWY